MRRWRHAQWSGQGEEFFRKYFHKLSIERWRIIDSEGHWCAYPTLIAIEINLWTNNSQVLSSLMCLRCHNLQGLHSPEWPEKAFRSRDYPDRVFVCLAFMLFWWVSILRAGSADGLMYSHQRRARHFMMILMTILYIYITSIISLMSLLCFRESLKLAGPRAALEAREVGSASGGHAAPASAPSLGQGVAGGGRVR